MNEYAAPAMAGKRWTPLKFTQGLFPVAVKALRDRAGLTQTEAAAELGVQPMTISQWERGAQTPHPLMQEGAITALKRLAKVRPSA